MEPLTRDNGGRQINIATLQINIATLQINIATLQINIATLQIASKKFAR
jgi:hypothetical protein